MVTDDEKAHAVLIDPSASVSTVRATFGALPKVEYLLLTHGHFDHMLTLDEWKRETGAPICVCAEDAAALTDATLNCNRVFFGKDITYPPADRLLRDGAVLSFGSASLRVMQTPGHTPGSCLYIGETDIFTGDTLMAEGGYGRCDLPGGSSSALYASLRKIFTLPLSYRIHPGHGGSSTLAEEKCFYF
jgi:glyoxylase-like metal-dependent hydrolase (beta-lactamase superfamily II)